MLVAHSEQPRLVGQLGQQAAALHHNGLRDHDDTRHNPYNDDALASPLGRALEHQRMADGVPAVQGDAAQCEYRHGDRDGLRRGTSKENELQSKVLLKQFH